MPKGSLVISLDFELYWGVRDKRPLEAYRSNLLGVRAAVPAMLEIFARYGVRATWATVGFLFCDGRRELKRYLPERLPRYERAALSPYAALDQLGESEAQDPFHFAPSLIERIARAPGQEIGTHSFSHYYCLEPGQSLLDFEADLVAARRVAEEKLGQPPRAMVFPRNQFNPRYLGVCESAGLRAFRGNLDRWIFRAKNESEERLLRRGVRLADHYAPLSGDNSYEARTAPRPLQDVPASRFLRPYSHRLRRLEGLRLSRILRDMEGAAARGRIYHLWWHPHNFGVNLGENLDFLDKVLSGFEALRTRFDFQSRTMSEACA